MEQGLIAKLVKTSYLCKNYLQMITVIVCSVNAERLDRLRHNIEDTIGHDCDHELLYHDNSSTSTPLAKVYNDLAAKASGENLLFIHEDAGFLTRNWGKEVEKMLSEPDCGVIGFAGTSVMVNAPGGWGVGPKWWYLNLEERGVKYRAGDWHGRDYVPVAVLDGFAFFVGKRVWKEAPFDESMLTGFHCYDLDFCLGVGKKYTNYVCGSIETYHDSKGNFGREWAEATGRLYLHKWSHFLPVVAKGEVLSPADVEKYTEKVYFRYLRFLKKTGLPKEEWLKRYKRLPSTMLHLRHRLKLPFVKK